jgi:hypothetical protein
MTFPNGAQIRDLVGDRYHLLPIGNFECPWHRRHITSDQVREHAERTRQRLWLPCERDEAWWPPRVRRDALAGLPTTVLPDGLEVAFIPVVERIGVVLQREWARIKQDARKARGPVLRHNYQTSLARFQRWQIIGPEALKAIHDQQRAILAGRANEHESRPLAYEDMGLPEWIFIHGRKLYCSTYDSDEAKDDCIRRISECPPFEMAIAAVVAATGYTWKAIDSAAHRTGKGIVPDEGSNLTGTEKMDETSGNHK